MATIPKRLLISRLESFKVELSSARGQHRTQADWHGFDNWRKRLESLLSSQFKRKWPFSHFKSLSFEPKTRYQFDPHLGGSPMPHDEHEASECFSRAADDALTMLSSMIEDADGLLAPERALDPASVVNAPGSIILQTGSVSGSQIQVGTTSSAQHAAFTKSTEALRDQLSAKSTGLPGDRRAAIEPFLALLDSDTEAVVEAAVTAIAKLAGASSPQADQAITTWQRDTRRAVERPCDMPATIVRARLAELKAELISAGQRHRSAAEWREFERWRSETASLLETAFGSRSWPAQWFVKVEYFAPGSRWHW